MVVDGTMQGSLQRFMRQPTSMECQVRSHLWSSPPPPQSTSCTGVDGSLQMFLRPPTSSVSQSLSDFLSSSPSPQLTFCSGADGSDLSMDQDDDTHEGVLEGSEDLYLDTGGPGPSLPDSRLCGRHFMAKTELRRRCRLCMKTESRGSAAYQSKISIVCKQCNVFLHFECFEEYHTVAHPVSKWAGGA
jgi:hypothetical protein